MVRAAGDCVISLGLLETLPPAAAVRILGTDLAVRVADAIGFHRCRIEPVLPDVAALFDLRRAGPHRAAQDLLRLRRALARPEHAGRTLLLEHDDWRNRLLVPARAGLRTEAPARGRSIYEDRHGMLQRVFGALPPLPTAARAHAPRTMLLNPGSRVPRKALPAVVVRNVARYCRARGLALCLLDPEGVHADARGEVDDYRARPPLSDSLSALRACDLYVGADSFFLHLAYRFGRPAVVIAPEPDPYFALPGARPEAMLTIGASLDAAALAAALDRCCVP